MLHYETILRLHEAIRGNNRIGVLIVARKTRDKQSNYKYKYGYVYFKNGVYYSNVVIRMFVKNEISGISFRNKVNSSFYFKREWKSIDSAIEDIFEYFKLSDKSVGEFTDLKNLGEIEEYLIKENLDYVIFKEG